MFIVATFGILVCMSLAMTRALMGPTVYDRVLAVNTFGTKTVLLKTIRMGLKKPSICVMKMLMTCWTWMDSCA